MQTNYSNYERKITMYKAILLTLVVILAFLIPLLSHASSDSSMERALTASGSASHSDDTEVVAIILLFGFALVMYSLCSLVVAAAAKSKGYSGIVFFILSIALSPIFGILAVIAFNPKQ